MKCYKKTNAYDCEFFTGDDGTNLVKIISNGESKVMMKTAFDKLFEW